MKSNNKSNMPLVTVIIPSYGQKEYLAQAINSALHQTVPCEVIVVDDGSTDGSRDVALSFGGIKVIEQINKGLASARNAGIMNAQGDYILPLDADDWLDGDTVERLLAFRGETDIIAPSLRCHYSGGITLVPIMEHPTFNDYRDGNRAPYCCLFKKADLLEVGGYSPRYDPLGGWEDLALMYDLLLRGKTLRGVQDAFFNYRSKEKSMWTETTKPENSAKLWDQLNKDFPATKAHRK